MTRVLAVNPNTSRHTTERLVEGIRAVAGLAVEVIGVNVAHGPAMIIDSDALDAAANAVVSTVEGVLAGGEQIEIIVVGAIGDPGRDRLRSLLDLPVIGIGESALREAAAVGTVAVVTTTPLLVPTLERLAATAAPEAIFAGVFLTTSDPLTLAADPIRQADELALAARDAVVAGAEAIVIGGAPLNEALDTLIAAVPGTTVIAPIAAAGRAVAQHVRR